MRCLYGCFIVWCSETVVWREKGETILSREKVRSRISSIEMDNLRSLLGISANSLEKLSLWCDEGVW